MKTCTACGITKNVDDFPLSIDNRTGNRYHIANCRECRNARNRQQKEKVRRARGTPSRSDASTHPEKRCYKCKSSLPRTAEYFHRSARNLDGLNSMCKTCARGAALRWSKNHPDQHRANIDRRRATKKCASQNGHIHIFRSKVWERDNGVCHICRQPCDPDGWHLDHIIPLSRGGIHSYENVAVSHPHCNLSKGSRIVEDS